MIPTDMKTEEQPKTALRSFTDTMLRAQAEADQPPQLVADQDKLIDEIIDLKQKLNAMVRIANVLSESLHNPRKWKDTFPEADQLVWNQLVAQGYGGEEVPE